MTWASTSDFFAMGGYAVYVWGAYGVTAACMLADPLLAARRHRRARDAATALSMRGETILDASR